MLIVTAEDMYDMDHQAMNEIGIDGRLLMENAGRAMSDRIQTRIKRTDCIRILAGSGNNGGDGFVIARTLLNKGYDAAVVQVVSNHKVTGDALFHKDLFTTCGGSVYVTWQPSDIEEVASQSDIIIDAMVGIGIKGMLRQPLAEVVSIINDADTYVISADIPSGLPADEGIQDFQAVNANETIIAEFPKMSAFLDSTSFYYGIWETVSFGIPPVVSANHLKRCIWTQEDFLRSMPERKQNAHKGYHGRGLSVGGSADMPGSVAMTTKAALRTGAGLLTTASTSDVIQTVATHCMEATYVTLGETQGFLNSDTPINPEHYDAAVIGMGMGRHKETWRLVQQMTEDASCPLIFDADGLYHLKPLLESIRHRTYPVILTPHPGEMAMLFDISVKEVLARPFELTEMFAAEYGVYVVLKGMYTIITTPVGQQTVNTTGNPGLAKGGSGDVLSGIILGMIMQRQTIAEALCNACFVHGKSADLLVEETHSVYDLVASDVIDGIANVYRTCLSTQ